MGNPTTQLLEYVVFSVVFFSVFAYGGLVGNPTTQLLKYLFCQFCLWWFSGKSNKSTAKILFVFLVFAYGGLVGNPTTQLLK